MAPTTDQRKRSPLFLGVALLFGAAVLLQVLTPLLLQPRASAALPAGLLTAIGLLTIVLPYVVGLVGGVLILYGIGRGVVRLFRRLGGQVPRTRQTNAGRHIVSGALLAALVLLLIAMRIPSFLPPPPTADETSAVGILRELGSALEDYRSDQEPPAYPEELSDLTRGNPSYVEPDRIQALRKRRYLFTYRRVRADRYTLNADPGPKAYAKCRHLFIDQTGSIRVSETGPADAASPPYEG